MRERQVANTRQTGTTGGWPWGRRAGIVGQDGGGSNLRLKFV